MQTLQQLEHRTNARIAVHLPIILELPPRIETNWVNAATRDMSSGGAFIEGGDLNIQAGTLVRLTLEAALKTPLVIDALVLRSEDHGVALMFANNGGDAFHPLAVWLEQEIDRHFMGRPAAFHIIQGGL